MSFESMMAIFSVASWEQLLQTETGALEAGTAFPILMLDNCSCASSAVICRSDEAPERGKLLPVPKRPSAYSRSAEISFFVFL